MSISLFQFLKLSYIPSHNSNRLTSFSSFQPNNFSKTLLIYCFFSQNPPLLNCQEVLQKIPPGTLRFMCHVSQRLDCPLKDMVINALCVIARGWHSPLHQCGTQDTQLHPKVTNQLSRRQSAQSDAF